MTEILEWKRIMMGDLPFGFLLEVAVRTLIMFALLIITLTFTGKRGVKQLSIFEIVIIIALGSAAGDPMFYEDVGILQAVVVFFIIICFYRFVTFLIGKFTWFENLVEGRTVAIIEDGKFSISNFKKEGLALDEFFSELRFRSIEHLGQVK
ncbi:MAG TPA: YetF domain-containing protein, partial [Flavobacterium sp.]|nr:YetF domain-containing protein [Flavobacterium sp.]